MFIEAENIVIRNAVADDSPILCNWWNDGKIMAHAGFPNGLYTTEQGVSENIKKGTDQHRILMLEVDKIPVGEMNYREIGKGVVEIGIKICDFNHLEKGLGTRFLRLLINYLFTEMGYENIFLDTNLKNTRAQHVYEKIGFKKVAIHLDAWKDQLGEFQSSVDYELTKDEFFSRKG